ncbi:hypothetical protein FRX31_019322 [Thalictrum thalictroides]|uniref:Protein kinase domain-containing protein n=1 Tax=Thalictrum thalictroides TaxID=46969 RepID=A0A7J6W1N7_THATH|nr:hypothetical protein FRX31_019322 [Thalictrum thalictroides]
MMEDPSRLEENLDALLLDMSNLKVLRDDRGERRMDKWLQNVVDKERQVDEIQDELKEIKKSYFQNINQRKKLNMKVIECRKAVKVLKERADEISETIEIFMTQVAAGKSLRFTPKQLRSYTSDFTTKVGSGGFADVYKGKFNGVQVAVKVLKDGMMDDMEKQFMAEVTDFGLAKLYSMDKSQVTTKFRGMRTYDAPEKPQDRPSTTEVVNILAEVIQPLTPHNPFIASSSTASISRGGRRRPGGN